MNERKSDGKRVCGRRVGLVAVGLLVASGCTRPVTLRATAYDLDARLDPGTHELLGRADVTLTREPETGVAAGTGTVCFALNAALNVTEVTAHGARIRSHVVTPPAARPQPETDGRPPMRVHELHLENVGPTPRLTFHYAGVLVQDVQAGEKRGQVHNFLMAAHVSGEGIYLDEGGGWYPLACDEHGEPQPVAALFHLSAEPVAGMRLVAAGEPAPAEGTRQVWRTRYPVTGMALVGGPHERKERAVGGVRIAAHYSRPDDPHSQAQIEKHTDLFLDAAAKYLERYQPLIGPYPYEHYTIVENFFSSGFAFPCFTLLNRALLAMGPRGLAHGMLDHEMLHAWWGNTILVDPQDGNWCEALTTFGANYYGYVLDGDERGARNQRRNFCVAVSRLKPAEDLPLGTFGRPQGAGREVGYSKGAMVFYMLSEEIGIDHFWAACRRLTADYKGRFVNWAVLQAVFEQQSGRALDAFMQQWVRATGTPELRLEAARWRAETGTLEVELAQDAPRALRVPLRIVADDGAARDEVVALDGRHNTAAFPFDRPPRTVVLDPDFRVLRRLRPQEIVPGVATTRAGRRLLVVQPSGVVSPLYQRVIDDFGGERGQKEVLLRTADDVSAAELSAQSVLIVGDGLRSPAVRALLKRAGCPLSLTATGFRFEDRTYEEPGHAVLCTVHHPDMPGCGITVYFGNSETALGRSDLLLHYRDSAVIFETTARAAEGKTVYESRPIARRDFESPTVVEVRR